MKNTLKDLNVYLHPKQKGIVNQLVEGHPILDTIPMKPASHGIYNVYSKVSDIDAMSEVDFDEELPTVGISFELGRTKLGKLGGKLPMPLDAANEMGGFTTFANSRLPDIIKRSADDWEFRLFNNGFKKAAIDNGNAIGCGGTTANKQYSMVAVTYDENSTVGLYNPHTVGNVPDAGSLFQMTFLNGGQLYELNEGGKKFIGKMIACYMQFGLQLADSRLVGALVNIEPTANTTDPDKVNGLPTAAQIDDMLSKVRAGSTTVIYCHPALGKKLASKYQLTQRQIANGESSVRYALWDWQGVPVITSYNIGWGNEAVVSL